MAAHPPSSRARTDRGPPLPAGVDPGGVPESLKGRRQWLIWKYGEQRTSGKWSKPALSPRTGRRIDDGDRHEWVRFWDAFEAYPRLGATGVSFVPAPGGPVGVDLDDIRDSFTGAIDPAAERVITDLGSFTELSPSETGLRAFVEGTRNCCAEAGASSCAPAASST